MNKSLPYKQYVILCDKPLKSHDSACFSFRWMRSLFFAIVFLSLTPSLLFAQEVLRGLSVNPELIKMNNEKKTAKQLKSTATAIQDFIKLPFVDDFSTTTVYPDPKLWSDKKVYINSTFPVNPITIGVIKLDKFDDHALRLQKIFSRFWTSPVD